MSKMMLIFDRPENCENCPAFYRIPGDFGCNASAENMMHWEGVQAWCPARIPPEHIKEVTFIPRFEGLDEISYMMGWNDCVDFIKGEAEG